MSISVTAYRCATHYRLRRQRGLITVGMVLAIYPSAGIGAVFVEEAGLPGLLAILPFLACRGAAVYLNLRLDHWSGQ
ncbi:MAG: hypothetical protein AAGB00_10525 [Planctomycetota bacterium]